MDVEKVNTIELTKCIIDSNCYLEEWGFDNAKNAYCALIQICNCIPRTTILEKSNNYWHAICRSAIFRFPDDLEILKIQKKGIIQIKSSSRFGAYDLGVNKKRIKYIYKELTLKGISKIKSN
tara:strand:+ start:363 stop:728 length:366 start_codon:yes stop_codon:yes gene_type:complete